MNRGFPPAARAVLACLIAFAISGPGYAQERDPRLVDHEYDADEVVRIEGKVGVQATIKFAEDELIENVAIGDSNAWQVTPNKRANLLFIKPLAPTAVTNLTVITDQRSYFFDLVANPRANPLYVLDFQYAEEAQQQGKSTQERVAEQPNAVEMAAANDPYAIVNPAALNFNWKKKGDKKLFPNRLYDDGRATFLAWPEDQAIPAILIKDQEGIEGPVNFAVRQNVLIIDGVPREIVLRSGRDAATLENMGPTEPVTARSAALARVEEKN